MQQHASNVLTAVSIQEASLAWGTSVIYGLVWFQCIKAEANRNLLPRKLNQPETWHSTVDQALRTTRSYQLLRVGVIRGHFAMLSALVERWRSKTHTFVMPIDEVTVTLEDVLHIFGPPIDGEVVTGWTDSSHDFLVTQSLAIFGSEPIWSHHPWTQHMDVYERGVY
ncbi:hypothetical protein Ahy_A03g016087 [Arachis hypogaea]|uniref:Aminotransferase-like plant mobile domain-containing protein n=1 Tax=Arachis hypogaea TaxID=3818 RepID=A0A445E293_ARAHY|nr:hypothetical protein Ahy_A03g016087 [Arachis hypogaea]